MKTAIITGASKGIGKALAKILSKEYHVILAARSEDKLKRLEIKNSTIIPTDVTKPEQVKELINKTIEKFGKIDIMINNAGILYDEPFENTTEQIWQNTIDVNLNGVYYGTKYAYDQMLKQKYGQIINVSSVVGTIASKNKTAYCASKFAVTGFTKALQKEAKAKNITVTLICPSATDTSIFDKSKPHFKKSEMMTPKEVANRIYKSIKKQEHKTIYIITASRILKQISKKLF